jgi:hypothetical protein
VAEVTSRLMGREARTGGVRNEEARDGVVVPGDRSDVGAGDEVGVAFTLDAPFDPPGLPGRSHVERLPAEVRAELDDVKAVAGGEPDQGVNRCGGAAVEPDVGACSCWPGRRRPR